MPQSLIRLSWSTIAAVAVFVPTSSLRADSPGHARVVCPPKCAVPGTPAIHPLMPAMPDAAPLPGIPDAPPTPSMPDAMPMPGTPDAVPMPDAAPMPMPTDPTLPPEAPAPDATTPDTPTPDPATPDATTPDDAANMPEPLTNPADDAASQTPLDLSFDTGIAAGGNEVAYANNPNMLGDLLRATRNVSFAYNLAGDVAGTNANGTVLFRNTKVSENNTAIPRNRVSFRYNWFHNGAQIDGFRAAPLDIPGGSPGRPFPPTVRSPLDLSRNGRTLPGGLTLPDGTTFVNEGQFGTVRMSNADFEQFRAQFDQFGRFYEGSRSATRFDNVQPLNNGTETQLQLFRLLQNPEIVDDTRKYDIHQYTIGWEQTFLNDNASLEVRIPFSNSIDSSLDLTGTQFIDDGFSRFLLADASNPNTLGGTDFELRDLQLIAKGLLYTRPKYAVSAGLGLTIPTADDVSLSIVDAFQDPFDPAADNDFGRTDGREGNLADVIRTRSVDVENESVGLAPFLAIAAAPTDRLFFNGFVQVDVPVNQDSVNITQTNFNRNVAGGSRGTAGRDIITQSSVSGKLRDQALLNLDVGGGYWLYRDPSNRGLTGLASLFELHYTTTLQDADILESQSFLQSGDERRAIAVAPQRDPVTGITIPDRSPALEAPLRIGNTENRLDILNATIGGVAVINEQATLAIGAGMPLRTDGGDKLFDVEVQAQFNLFFDRLGAGAFGNPSSFR